MADLPEQRVDGGKARPDKLLVGQVFDQGERACPRVAQAPDERLGREGSGRGDGLAKAWHRGYTRSEEHTSELQSLMRISYAVFCLKKKKEPSIKHEYLTRKATQNDTRPS